MDVDSNSHTAFSFLVVPHYNNIWEDGWVGRFRCRCGRGCQRIFNTCSPSSLNLNSPLPPEKKISSSIKLENRFASFFSLAVHIILWSGNYATDSG